MWVGLAAASLVVIACICGLASASALAAYRLNRSGSPSPTPVADTSGLAATPLAPTRPALEVPTLPRESETWPVEDVPMPAEADLSTLIGTADSFSVITDQEFKDVMAFYQDELERRGWSKVDYGTRITSGDAELHYRKGETDLTVILARIPFVGTLVQIRVPSA
jgi:hypothetical protein